MTSLCSNIIKSDYVKIKGRVSLNNLTKDEKQAQAIEDEIKYENESKFDISHIEEEINQKMTEAQKKYEEILNKANEESQAILCEAQEKAIEIEKKAYHEGYEQGIKNGYEDGYKEAYEDNIEKAKKESSEIIDRANKMIIEANDELAYYIKENKQNILALSISIAEKVLRVHLEDEGSMNSMILAAIKEYELKENFIIRVNSIYKESLNNEIFKLKENKVVNKDVFVLSDDLIDKGNAVIESARGKITIGIDDVIGKVKEELL